MHLRRLLILPLLLALAACASSDKYPYPPQFVAVEDVPARALAAPPAQYSETYRKELRCILARQAVLSGEDKAAIMAEDHIAPAMMITPVLGTQYTQARYPALYSLLGHAASDAWRIGDTTQDYWGRTRPWLADARVTLLAKPIKRPSYPSGHSTTNHVWAAILADLFPAKRAALFDRAYAIGQHRVDGGVHFPSDVEAGKALAAVIYEQMQQNPAYLQELRAARAEIAAHGRKHAANDNTPLPHGAVAGCTTPQAGMSMTLCR